MIGFVRIDRTQMNNFVHILAAAHFSHRSKGREHECERAQAKGSLKERDRFPDDEVA